MKVWGLDVEVLQEVAAPLDMVLENVRTKEKNKVVEFKLSPVDTRSRYARRTPKGKRIKALCFHGFEKFVTAAFQKGANRVSSVDGNWKTRQEFQDALYGLEHKVIDGQGVKAYMANLCSH